MIKENFIKIKNYVLTRVSNLLISKKEYTPQEIDTISSLNNTKNENLTAFLYDLVSILISTALIFFIIWLAQTPINYFFPNFLGKPLIIGKSLKQLFIPVYSIYVIIALFVTLLSYLESIKILNLNLKEKQQ